VDPHCDIIPPPPIVRERLAATLRQTALLRRQLKLSERAADERRQGIASEQGPADNRKAVPQ
jgi:hypothetical protein